MDWKCFRLPSEVIHGLYRNGCTMGLNGYDKWVRQLLRAQKFQSVVICDLRIVVSKRSLELEVGFLRSSSTCLRKSSHSSTRSPSYSSCLDGSFLPRTKIMKNGRHLLQFQFLYMFVSWGTWAVNMICDLQQVSINQKYLCPMPLNFACFYGGGEGGWFRKEKAEQLRGVDRHINKRRLSIV